jgi:ankyrin repeat protein
MNKISNFLCLSLLLLGATALGMDNSERHLGVNNPELLLLDAAENGNFQKIERLIAHDASVEAKDVNGFTSLMLAAFYGHEAVCGLLIANKASVEAKTNKGVTPLMCAAGSAKLAVCMLLIANKASAAAKDIDGWTPLIWAVRNRHKEVGKLLINAQLESIRKDEAAIITLLGISKKRQAKLSCHMPYDIAKIIARQALATVQQSKRLVIEQVNEIGNPEARAAWLVYANEQMNSVNK